VGAAKLKGLLWVIAACALAAVMALGLPVAARRLPWGVERWMARVLDSPPAARTCGAGGGAGALALDPLVHRIYPVLPGDADIPITVDVLGADTVNAYATLGGHIHVFDGLLQKAQSPEELAGVLAHEIEHVRNRHITQDLAVKLLTISVLSAVLPGEHGGRAQAAYLLLTLKFSRQQEAEADRLGLERLKAAHVDAAGFRTFFARARQQAAPPEFLSSHPDDENRAELAAQYTGYPVEPVLDAERWQALKTICRHATGP
jgi:beta-barrel assembly-enhancing protease